MKKAATISPAFPLLAFGTLVRESRVKKKLTQQRAARDAGISRKQWAAIEQGRNVSGLYIKIVAHFLELELIPLGDRLYATTENGSGIDVTTLLNLADEIVAFAASVAERFRAIAMEAVLPRSERGRDSDAIAAIVALAQAMPPDRSRNLTSAIHDLASAVAPKVIASVELPDRPQRRRKRKE